jgi:membrane-associated phospholipid phosphatase
MTAEQSKLSSQPAAPVSLRPSFSLLLLWAITLPLLVILFWNNAQLDTYLWRAVRWNMGSQDAYQWSTYKTPVDQITPDTPWYHLGHPPFNAHLYARTEKIWRILRDMGEPQMTVVLLFVVGIYHRKKWRAALTLLASTLFAGGIGTLIRFSTSRLRPDAQLPGNVLNEGSNIWQPFRALWIDAKLPFLHISGGDLAFPSGHATLAFATAAVLSYLSPKGRPLFLTLATGCALARVIMQAHFPSDILFGAALGYTLAALATPKLDRLLTPRFSNS